MKASVRIPALCALTYLCACWGEQEGGAPGALPPLISPARVMTPLDRTPADSLLPCSPLDSLGPAEPDATLEDVRGRRRWSCHIADALPPSEVALIGDSTENRIVSIELPDGDSVAALAVDADEPPFRGARYLGTQDLDGDGFRDLQLLLWWGVTGNVGYTVWRYQPDSGRFVYDAVVSELDNPQPIGDGRCLLSRSTGGMAGAIYNESVYCWRGESLVEVERTDQDYDNTAEVLIRTVRRQSDADTLVVVSVDTTRVLF
jgi:hypothetical protein